MAAHTLLNTAGSNYNEIIDTQETAYLLQPWATVGKFRPRISLDWTKAILKIYWETPTWDAVIQNFATNQTTNQYIFDNTANWNKPNSI
jgi:hypothetical protein